MPIFTAAAAAIGSFFAGITLSSVASFAVRTLVTIGISKLVANRANKTSVGAQDAGGRVQLAPATNNKLVVSYGSAFLASNLTDAKITTDQKTMYYVFSICEASSGTMSFGKILWNGKEVTLGTGDYGGNNKVVSLTTNATTPQVDNTINGYAWIYQFSNGSSSGVNTGGTSAITILQDAGIPVADRWTSTDTMTNTCFMVVKVVYNKDVQDVQQMPRLSIQVTNTLTKPGDVIYDYMTDSVYGCAIDPANIDSASITALNTYSDELITYTPVGGGSATQARYRIDGPVNTGDNCLSNLQQLVDACDSWLQYNELLGQWTIVINKPYSGTLSSLYSVDSDVLIGGIDINPIDLNQTYNSLEVQYPNANINDQTDYKVVDLTTVGTAWYNPSLLSPNEPDNRLVIQYPQINNYIRAVYLGVRRLLQSREDLTIVCNLDYSGIQITAGDVVRVTLAEYGWTDKLFRVSQVQETKTSDGFLGARITAFEYNGSIYADNALTDFVPEANTGLSDPNIFDRPSTPVITTNTLANSGAVRSFTVSSNVPANGTTLYMDFNYGNTNNVASHKSYTSTQLADGTPYTNGQTVSIEINDLPVGNYYFSTTARNELAGRASFSSTQYNWSANLQANSVTYNNLTPGATGLAAVTSYDVANYGGNLLIPIAASSTSTRNIPLIYPGSNVSAGYVFPYAQGNSTTANGYAQNSTTNWTPNGSALLYVASSSGSYQNWYKLIDVDISQATWTSDEFILSMATFNMYSDTANTIVQVVPYARFSNDLGNNVLQTQYLSTFTITNAFPSTDVISVTYNNRASNTVSSVGMYIRNITGGSNVTVYTGSYAVQQRYIGPGSII